MRKHASWVVARGFSQNTGFPAGNRRENVLLVRGPPRADDDRIDVTVIDQGLTVRMDQGAARNTHSGRLGHLDVHVRHSDYGRPGQHSRQSTDMVLPDHPRADDADFQRHA
jgi:hypothetical protein